MKNQRQSLTSARMQWILGTLLFVGIVAVALAPVPRSGLQRGVTQLFYLAEEDYLTPMLGSYDLLKVLAHETKSFEGFAGFEQHAGRFAHQEKAGLASVTRYSGKLFEIASVSIFAQEINTYISPRDRVYVSEKFWREKLGGALDILGTELMVDGVNLRVMGITRKNDGILQGTDLWVPLCTRDPIARVESLRIIGRLNADASWNSAQKDLLRCLKHVSPKARHRLECKMVPAETWFEFETRALEVDVNLENEATEASAKIGAIPIS